MPSGSEHCSTRQRTCFEGLDVVVEHVHDIVDNFLGQTHTSVVDRDGYRVEVDRFRWLRHLYVFGQGFALGLLADEPSRASAEHTNWLCLLVILKSYKALRLRTKVDHLVWWGKVTEPGYRLNFQFEHLSTKRQ